MVQTKCQPKSWDGQNANHRKKSGQNANLGWHYVRLAFCPVGILSYHLWGGSIPLSVQHKHKHPHPLVYLRGPEENNVILIYMSEERSKVYECQLQKESEV